MKQWLRQFLGISDLLKQQQQINDDLTSLRSALDQILYNEDDLQKREISDRIGQKAIEKLPADDWARRHTLGEI